MIFATTFNVELVRIGFRMTTIEVVSETITERQRMLTHVELNFIASILSGAVVGEGGAHRFVSYERIIGAQRRLSRSPVPVIQLSIT